MYWEEAEVQKFLSILSEGFDELEAHFDFLYKGLVHRSSRHDVLKRMQAEFKWGCDGRQRSGTAGAGMETAGLYQFH